MIDVIKEYLVSVGFGVDNKSVDKAKAQMNDMEKHLGKFADTSAGKFASLSVAMVTFYETFTLAIGKFAVGVAQADRQVELLARRFYTTEANARSLSATMKAMGLTSMEQLKDVALNPEMRGQFMEMRGLARSLESPESQKGLQYIREVNFEFQKLGVRIEYFKQQVVSAFATSIKPAIEAFKKDFEPMMKDFQKNGAKYANAIGKFLGNIAQMGIHITEVFGKTFEFIKNLPDTIKQIGQASIALFVILTTKLGWIFFTLQSIFLMIDDFMVYLKGGKSYYSDAYDVLTGKVGLGDVVAKQENSLGRAFRNYQEAGGGLPGIGNAIKGAWNYREQPRVYEGARGHEGKFGFSNGMYISKPVQDFLRAISPLLSSNYTVTSGWENRGGAEKGHKSGLKYDVGLAGKSFNERLDYLKAIAGQQSMAESFVEVNTKNEYNRYIHALQNGGADTSRFHYLAPKHGENIDVRVAPPSQKVSININGGNPMQIAHEVKKEIAYTGIRADQGVIV